MSSRRLAVLSAALLAALSCGGTDTTEYAGSPERTVTAISLSMNTASLAIHQPFQVDALFRDQNGVEIANYSGATWKSADPSIVSVNTGGLMTPQKIGGPIALTVSAGSATATVTVTVVPTVGVIGAAPLLEVDSALTVSAAYVDFYGAVITPITATWNSTNAAVARVDAVSGRVTGVSAGTATITASNGGVTSGFTVEVGVATPFDGTWRGTSRGNLTLSIAFGTVRSFSWPYSAVIMVDGTTCQVLMTATYSQLVADNRFAVNIPYSGKAEGEFVGSAMTLRITGLNIPQTEYTCTSVAARNALGAVPVAGTTTVSMTR